MPEPLPVFVIDGSRFDGLGGFWNEVERVLIPNAKWGRNLDALADVLAGGFGTPTGGFVVRWVYAARSRELLGFPETARWLEQRLPEVHASNRAEFARRLEHARNQRGETLFEALVDIFRSVPGVTFELVD
jgi:RNAse (barnase) inhibitor barstar